MKKTLSFEQPIALLQQQLQQLQCKTDLDPKTLKEHINSIKKAIDKQKRNIQQPDTLANRRVSQAPRAPTDT